MRQLLVASLRSWGSSSSLSSKPQRGLIGGIRPFSSSQPGAPFSRFLKTLDGTQKAYYDLAALGGERYEALPYSVRILLESAVRNCDGFRVSEADVDKILDWPKTSREQTEIPFLPARVLLQDFTGVPAVVDLAAMRDAMSRLGGDPRLINPLVNVDLVVDHSVQVDYSRSATSLQKNLEKEMQRNKERFAFLKWGSKAFNNMRIVPPGSGIVHQVNLEFLASVVMSSKNNSSSSSSSNSSSSSSSSSSDGLEVLYPDSVVGTDSHTTMINGLGVLGWGVGGIEAEAVMLGQHISMVLPEVVGVHLTGQLGPLVTATDLVLTLTENLRKKGVVGKFVEFFGPGLASLSLADRATVSNMAPEYGEIKPVIEKYLGPETFKKVYSTITEGTAEWKALSTSSSSVLYDWRDDSTYIHNPPFFKTMERTLPVIEDISSAYCLLMVGDSITTDHISPAGNIAKDSPAARYLESKGITRKDFNTYGSRRGNDEVMVRGTFANIRLVNKMCPSAGPKTIHLPSGDVLFVSEAAERYKKDKQQMIVIAGKEYGSGSSRDWAAKGPYLQGVRAVIAESFERIHRSNLVGMGILPLQFLAGESAESLKLTGHERFSIGLNGGKLVPGSVIEVSTDCGKLFKTKCRIDTDVEVEYFRNGGALHYVLRNILNKNSKN